MRISVSSNWPNERCLPRIEENLRVHIINNGGNSFEHKGDTAAPGKKTCDAGEILRDILWQTK